MGSLMRYLKNGFGDKLFLGTMALFVMVILLKALFVPIPENTEVVEYADGWNTRAMTPATGLAAEEAETLYQIKRVFDSEDEFPRGLKIKAANIQGTRVLVVFEKYRDLNRTYDRDYMAVYDVSGNWMYGFEGVLPYSSTRIALNPEKEGVLLWEWKMKQTENELFLLVDPDGHKKMYVTEDIWSDTPAYWKSDYKVIQTKESKLVIAHTDTGEQVVIFDYSDAYPEMYPSSSKIDEDHEATLNGLIPIIFMILMIFLLPWMMDNPDIPKRGIRELHGDLRDRR